MRLTYAEINLRNLQFNYLNIKKRVENRKIMAVVKADAYGHGMIDIVKALSLLGNNRPEYYGVALIEEAVKLRKAKIIKEPVLTFSPFDFSEIDIYKKYKIYPTITSSRHYYQLRKYKSTAELRVHINIDTGMGRLGIRYDEALEIIYKLAKLKNVKIDGIYTHFATSDEKDKTFANIQLKRFGKIIRELKKMNINFGLIHTANSGAIIDMPDSWFDMVRPGISLYGYYPSLVTLESIKLKPVMSLISSIDNIKKIKKGESISYGRKYFASKDMNVVSIPIGYADGIIRTLTNNISGILKGKIVRQIGRVTMDRIIFDSSNLNVKIGDKIILLGKKGPLQITAWDWATNLNTIPYEITCGISKRVPRVYL